MEIVSVGENAVTVHLSEFIPATYLDDYCWEFIDTGLTREFAFTDDIEIYMPTDQNYSESMRIAAGDLGREYSRALEQLGYLYFSVNFEGNKLSRLEYCYFP
ncbi:hypothetical protein LJC27_07470 [Christensenellaceae bacterium OttesenSCG-928-M15]|nr:hypothetical protein [Christensenellaceae bacterium OttesenSCG-928-M15]